jgi:hypothetical protein
MNGKCSLDCPCYRCTPWPECHGGVCKRICERMPGCALSRTISLHFDKRSLLNEMDRAYFQTLLEVLGIEEKLFYGMIEDTKKRL